MENREIDLDTRETTAAELLEKQQRKSELKLQRQVERRLHHYNAVVKAREAAAQALITKADEDFQTRKESRNAKKAARQEATKLRKLEIQRRLDGTEEKN